MIMGSSNACDELRTACKELKTVAAEAVKFNAARKIPLSEYNDWVVVLPTGVFITLEDLREVTAGKPEYVYGVVRNTAKILEFSIEDFKTKGIVDGVDLQDLPGVPGLIEDINKLIATWNSTPNDSYDEDPSVVIELGEEFWAGEAYAMGE